MDAAREPTISPEPVSYSDLERMREESRRAIERTRAGLERVESVIRAWGTPNFALHAHAPASSGEDLEVPHELRGRRDPADTSDPLDGEPRAN